LLAKLMTMKNDLLTVESNGKASAGALGKRIECLSLSIAWPKILVQIKAVKKAKESVLKKGMKSTLKSLKKKL
jgi:hypothetical protein